MDEKKKKALELLVRSKINPAHWRYQETFNGSSDGMRIHHRFEAADNSGQEIIVIEKREVEMWRTKKEKAYY